MNLKKRVQDFWEKSDIPDKAMIITFIVSAPLMVTNVFESKDTVYIIALIVYSYFGLSFRLQEKKEHE